MSIQKSKFSELYIKYNTVKTQRFLSMDSKTNEPIFTTSEYQQYKVIKKTLNAKKYLSETDWYVTRQAEVGTPIPEDILSKRAQARIDAS